jgi:hypothetical protein
MGNQCCKEPNENVKPNAFSSADNSDNNNSATDANVVVVIDDNARVQTQEGGGSNPTTVKEMGQTTSATPDMASLSPGQRLHELDRGGNNNDLQQQHKHHHRQQEQLQLQQNQKAAEEQEQQLKKEEEQKRSFQQEQNRLDEIVALASRDMVTLINQAIDRGGGGTSMNSLTSRGSSATSLVSGSGGRGGGGNEAYYDPSYANFISQDLSRRFTQNSSEIDKSTAKLDTIHHHRDAVPDTSIFDARGVIDELNRSTGTGTGFLKTNNVEDRLENFVHSVFVTKEKLLKDIGPIVENVLTGG